MNKRIDETKREIAQLNEELEKLISSNVNKRQNPTDVSTECPAQEDDVQIPPASEEKTKGHVGLNTKNSKPFKLASVKDVSIKSSEQGYKKQRTYNREAAKEYIREQREKWMQERKKSSSKTNIDKATIKQNLCALSLKSRALVQRNVQQKKERIRTSSTQGQIRLDRKFTYSPKINQPQLSRLSPKSPRIKKDHLEVPNSSGIPIAKSNLSESNVSHQKQESPGLNGIQLPLQNVTFRKRVPPSTSNQLCRADQDLAATKIQAFYRGHRTRKELADHLKSTPKISVMAHTCTKESKETQTSLQQKQNEPLIRHHTVPIDPYPCNFINTIKRKLQFVVHSPVHSRDIGVQGSLREINEQGNKVVYKGEQSVLHSSEPSSRSNLNSFLSHKRTNLDVDALKHLALLHHGSKNLGKNERLISDSDSDTSKNIPEISTESGSVSVQKERLLLPDNLNNSFLGINTEKIDKLHLQNPLLTEKNQPDLCENISNLENSYTFNFDDDKPDDLSPKHKEYSDKEMQDEKFVKSRDSIISFNKSDFSPKHKEYSDKETQEEKFLKSPRDSIISFNKSAYDEFPNSGVLTNDDVYTEDEHANFSPAVSKSIQSEKQRVMLSARDPMLPNQNGSKLGIGSSGITTKLDIVETIISSADTSFISSISEQISDVSKTSDSKVRLKETSLSSIESKLSSHQYDSNGKSSSGNMKNSKISLSQRSDSSHMSSHHNSSTNKTKSSINTQKSKTPSEVSNENNSQLRVSDSTDIPTESLISKNKFNTSISIIPTKPINEKPRIDERISTSTTSEVSTETSMKEIHNNFEKTNTKTLEFLSLHSSDFLNSGQVSLKKQNSSTDSKNITIRSHDGRVDFYDQMDKGDLNANNVMNVETQKEVSCSSIKSKSYSNELHTKFEAEVHLLNDFNESLKQFMEVEKAFETIKNKNDERSKKEISKRSIGLMYSEDSKISLDLSKSIVSSINLSRGTNIDDSQSQMIHDSSVKKNLSKDISIFEDSSKCFPNNMAGLSIKMFEQLIRDEDVRIENLKTIIKIREQALLDRTKGELAWLEIQRKHLKETGKLHEASLVKKKQRGILLKHQEERREMQRLKQLQKTQSNERKSILKEQQNLIKAKLTSEKIMTDFKKHTPRRKRSIGPMKVLKSSEHSETSISKKESDGEEIISVTSTRSRSIHLSEIDPYAELTENNEDSVIRDNENLSNMRRALLMRQSALMKRRKAVEDLLQKHQKLLQEEKKIEKLEMAANAIIMQMPTTNQPKQTVSNQLRVKGHQLNELGLKMDAFTEKKFVDNRTYNIPQTTYNKLFVQPENYRSNQKKSELVEQSSDRSVRVDSVIDSAALCHILNNSVNVVDESGFSKKQYPDYSTDFDIDTQVIESGASTEGVVDQNNLSSISGLIQDFSKIELGISMLSRESEPNSHRSSTNSENISESIKEISVIETNKTTPRTLPTSDAQNIQIQSESIISKQDSANTDGSVKNGTLQSLTDDDVVDVMASELVLSDTTLSHSVARAKDHIKFNSSSSQVNEEIPLDQSTEQVISEDIGLDGENSSENINEETLQTNYAQSSIIAEESHKDRSLKGTSDDISTDVNYKSISNSTDVLETKKHDSSSIEDKEIHENFNEIEAVGIESANSLSNDIVSSIVDEISFKIPENSVQPIITNDDTSHVATIDAVLNEENSSESPSTKSPNSINVPEEVYSENEGFEFEKYGDAHADINNIVNLNGTNTPIISEYDNINSAEHKSEMSKAEELSTDISEKLSTDTEQIVIQEISPSQASSDNYSDDFEEDSPILDQADENTNSTSFEKKTSHPEEEHSFVEKDEMEINSEYENNEEKSNWGNIPTIMLNGEVLSDDEVESSQVATTLEDVEAQLSPNEYSGDNKVETSDVDVKQRVSEILANTLGSPTNKEQKIVRCHDYYVTTYEDVTPSNSPESEPTGKSSNQISSINIFGNEAEELLKKQLAIEQEIKHLEQQQKEQLPFVYMREIPNKPPPPYTPPSSVTSTAVTILPSKVEDLNEICNYSAKVLFNAYLSNNLSVFTFSETDFKSINQTKSTRDCCLFVFDLCREVAEDHYKKFEKENVRSWFQVPEGSKLTLGKPFGYRQLEKHINSKVKELLGFEKPNIQENSIIKWNRKKKDHVDEILLLESQAEERGWLNYDNDELIIKNEVTNQIFDILLSETVEVFRKIFPSESSIL